MIKSFLHKGLQAFFETGSKAGIRPDHAHRLSRQLSALDQAAYASDMNLPGWRFHKLQGDLVGYYSVAVNGNWRLTFRFEDGHAHIVDYQGLSLRSNQ